MSPTNTNLSDKQATERNADTFVHDFGALCQAGIGVIAVRTREPYRALENMREYSAASDRECRFWTFTKGWALFDPENPEADPVADEETDPIEALRKLTDSESNFGERGVFIMMYPHKPLAQAFVMVQIIKEYCQTLCEGFQRLVLLVPPSFALPEELEDDVVIIDFDAPSYAELAEQLPRVLGTVDDDAQTPQIDDALSDRIVSAGAGMTAHEFDNAVARAMVSQGETLPAIDAEDFVKVIRDVKTEVVKRSEILEVMEPGSIDEIGGLENLKLWVRKRARCFDQDARDFGIEPPKGIALIGPPGTGKSLGAKAIASVLGITALKFDVGRVFNSLVGQSEARVRAALKMVDAMAPCVLMIDEADKAFAGQAGGGGGGDSGVGMRVLGAILTWMQETTAPVFVVVTANRTQNLPTEFLRRGRLDEIFSVTVPHEGERKEIIDIHLRKRGFNPAEISGLDKVAEQSNGYVPAELEAAVKDAIIEAYTAERELSGEMIAEQLSYLRPLKEAFAEDFKLMQDWAEKNARPASLAPGKTKEVARAPRQRTRPAPSKAGTRKLSLDG